MLEFADRLNDHDPDDLAKLFAVQEASPLEDLLRETDPLTQIDPTDTQGAISPVGFLHIFRQYFFDLGSFLGEPVEHIWLAPGTTIELIETSSRRVLTERSMEELMDTTLHTEQDLNVKDEISEAVKAENQSNTKLAVSLIEAVNYGVFQGKATQDFGADSSRKDSRETAHKNSRETTEKIATELKRSFKTSFKTTMENIDTRSRRHVIQNTSTDLVNYEMRRKMRRIGVQLQDLGTRLCWQVFVDDPGDTLGLAEMVDLVGAPDLSSLKNPDHIPYEAVITKKITVPFTYKPLAHHYNTTTPYAYRDIESGAAIGDSIESGNDSQIFMADPIVFDSPKLGYRASGARLVGVPSGKIANVRSLVPGIDASSKVIDNLFEVIFQELAFGGETAIALEWEVDFVPVDPIGEQARIQLINNDADKKYDGDKARLLKRAYLDAIRTRIKNVNNIRSRPAWDLREEERTIIYRKLIEKLMLGVWKPDHDADTQRVAHLRSEVIRSIFDVDAMLYFVAPEWWKARERSALGTTVDFAGVDTFDSQVLSEDPQARALAKNLTPTQIAQEDRVSWNDGHLPNRAGNYKITEDSSPARLGSSLGWLLQLDGDNLRNAFLNSPWVKAVLPIRPGREEAALNWLRSVAEGPEGLDQPYSGTDSDPDLMGKTISEALDVIAKRMSKANGDFGQTLAKDEVFETGFNPLAKSFDARLSANEVFSQWISIVPTDQIVAQKYEPTELMTS